MIDTPPLSQRLLPLVLFGSVVGAIRFAAEFIAPEQSMYFGLYYLMPPAILWVGLTKRWGAVRWTQVAGTMVVLAFLTWFVWNSIAYVTGQFVGWEHGRFGAGRAPAIAETTMGKLTAGLAKGGLTTVAGSLWCVVFGTVFIWLPARFGNKSG